MISSIENIFSISSNGIFHITCWKVNRSICVVNFKFECFLMRSFKVRESVFLILHNIIIQRMTSIGQI